MRVFPTTLALLASAGLPLSSSAQVPDYEVPPIVSAADILPAELLKSEHHEVDDAVRSDGYLNYYVIRSDFGDFEVASDLMLQLRIREIEALVELDATSKTGVFIKAAADAGVGQIKTITQFATNPIKTVIGIPKGIGRMFTRYRRQAEDGLEAAREIVDGDEEDGTSGDDDAGAIDAVAGTAAFAVESYLSISSAERAWHRELGTDPYTSNEVLQKAVKSVAWADRLGRFGIRQVGIPKIPGVDIIQDVNEAVWSKDPYELKDYNRGILEAIGADEGLIEAFLDSHALSPTLQTFLVAAIADMEGIEGRDHVVRGTLTLISETEARFYTQSAIMLAWYHHEEDPVVSIDDDTSLPVGIKADGTTVMILPADYLYWNETLATAAEVYRAARDSDEPVWHEIWLTGEASERTHHEAAVLGWDIHENLAIMTAPDTEESPDNN